MVSRMEARCRLRRKPNLTCPDLGPRGLFLGPVDGPGRPQGSKTQNDPNTSSAGRQSPLRVIPQHPNEHRSHPVASMLEVSTVASHSPITALGAR
jgi:hypothetical protein